MLAYVPMPSVNRFIVPGSWKNSRRHGRMARYEDRPNMAPDVEKASQFIPCFGMGWHNMAGRLLGGRFVFNG